MQARTIALFIVFFFSTGFFRDQDTEADYTSTITTAGKIKMYWKHDGKIIRNFKALKKIEPNLVFAMNGGMYTEEYAPVGLYVEDGKQLKAIKKYNNPTVNFGMQPQGIFLIRGKKAEIVTVDDYTGTGVVYATQSAPMLVVNSKINPLIGISKNYIRNGVGILPDGHVLMAVSKTRKSFKQFAQYFIDNKCVTALYLDGAISEAYTGNEETYGKFGVMIGVLK